MGTPGVSRVVIATDHESVLDAARSFGAEVCMTSPSHPSGTDRVAEAVRTLPLTEDVIVNVQGDEPMIRRDDVARVVALFDGAPAQVTMTTLAVPRTDAEGVRDPNNVKVVRDAGGRALYFSRSPIPSHAFAAGGELPWLHHVGIYGYRREFLLRFSALPPGRLEAMERLEQLRALEAGFEILVGDASRRYRGIDTEEEYRAFVREIQAGERGSAPGEVTRERGR